MSWEGEMIATKWVLDFEDPVKVLNETYGYLYALMRQAVINFDTEENFISANIETAYHDEAEARRDGRQSMENWCKSEAYLQDDIWWELRNGGDTFVGIERVLHGIASMIEVALDSIDDLEMSYADYKYTRLIFENFQDVIHEQITGEI